MALTHMRGPNDCRLAEQAAGIDLILGGHDHDYFAQKVSTVFTPNIFIFYIKFKVLCVYMTLSTRVSAPVP